MTGRQHRTIGFDVNMESDETHLTFSGNDGVECEKFIHAIRRTAYIAGKVRDNDWIMDLVYSTLTGEALRWHLSLPPEDGNNWRTLERLMVERFPRKKPISPRSPSTTMDLRTTFSSASPAPPNSITGRIGVYKSDGEIHGYITIGDEVAGVMKVHPSISEALELQCVYSSQPGVIIIGSWPGYEERWLGAIQWENPLDCPHFYAAVSVTDENATTCAASMNPKAFPMVIRNKIWSVHPASGEVSILWPLGDRKSVLTASVDVKTGFLFLVEEFAPWAHRCVKQGAAPLQVSLRFEPM